MVEFFSFGVLLFLWWAQSNLRSFFMRVLTPFFFLSATVLFFYSFYQSYLQYRSFDSGIFHEWLQTKGGVLWFLSYIQLHFWNPYLTALFVGIGIVFLFRFLNRRFGERFFEREEPILAGLAVFLVGYPSFLFYLFAVLVVYLFFHFFSFIRARDLGRVPLYTFWLPSALFVILVTRFWLEELPWWKQFVF